MAGNASDAFATITGDRGETGVGPIGQWARKQPQRVALITQIAVLLLFEAVSVGNQYSTGTPVDTGYARAAWTFALGAPNLTVQAPPPHTKGGVAVLPPPAAPDVSALTLGATAYLTNPVGYVSLLEYGYTVPLNPETPAGFVMQAVRQWPRMVGDATRQVRAGVQSATDAASASAFADLTGAAA